MYLCFTADVGWGIGRRDRLALVEDLGQVQ